MCIYLSLESKTKKLYLYLILMQLVYVIYNFFYKYIQIEGFWILEFYILSLGQILTILPYLIYQIYKKCCHKNDYNESAKESISKNNIKDYIILILNIAIIFCYELLSLCPIFSCEFNEFYLLFALSLLMKVYTDFKFHRHKVLALIIYALFALINDIYKMKKNNNYPNIKNLLNFFFFFYYLLFLLINNI